MAKEETKTEVKEEKKVVEITDVITETAEAFKLPDGQIVNINNYLVWLGNMILSIKKSVA